jgi:type III pantothenate kinase
MTQLLIDLGNTRIKWTERGPGGIGEVHAIEHSDPAWLAEFAEALALLPDPSAIALAAVAPELIVAAAQRALAARWPQRTARRVYSTPGLRRFRSAYGQPERMGVDRFLAATAAAESKADILVIGCGTALTIDLIEASGQHLGGLIAPAPETMRAAVLSRTARVHWLREGSAVDFGCSTEDALEGGVWAAAAGMVERSLRKAALRLGAAPHLIAHGGSAPALARALDMPLAIDQGLVLNGLAMWMDAQDNIGAA